MLGIWGIWGGSSAPGLLGGALQGLLLKQAGQEAEGGAVSMGQLAGGRGTQWIVQSHGCTLRHPGLWLQRWPAAWFHKDRAVGIFGWRASFRRLIFGLV